MKLSEIAKRLNCRMDGHGDVEITGVAGLEEAGPQDLTFLSNPKYVRKLRETRASAVIVGEEVSSPDIPTLISPNPYLAFAQAIEIFYSPPAPVPGIHPTAWVADSARLGRNCSIGAHATVGHDVSIGENAVLHPGVSLYPFVEVGDDFVAHANASVREYSRIGNRVILQNNAVIGSDGFGFAPQEDGSYYKIVQSGIVVLEDDVEIGANSCIDRSTVGETRIEAGTKIDNLVQIGHGSRVGRHSVLAAQVGLAGSTKVGNHVMLGGQVGVAGHLSIGDRVVVIAQSGVGRSIEPGRRIAGSPEMDSGLWKRNYILMHRLPDLFSEVKELRRQLEEMGRGTEKERPGKGKA